MVRQPSFFISPHGPSNDTCSLARTNVTSSTKPVGTSGPDKANVTFSSPSSSLIIFSDGITVLHKTVIVVYVFPVVAAVAAVAFVVAIVLCVEAIVVYMLQCFG